MNNEQRKTISEILGLPPLAAGLSNGWMELNDGETMSFQKTKTCLFAKKIEKIDPGRVG